MMNALLPKQLFPHVDQVMIVLVIALASLGFVVMSSASMGMADIKHGNAFYFVWRQALYLVIAAALAYAVFIIPSDFWSQHSGKLLMIAFAMLIIVLVVGREINGSKRWIPLGIINFQASEVAKIFILIFIAGYCVRRQQAIRESWSGIINATLVLMAVTFLLMMEPDFGTTAILLVAAATMIYIAGLGNKQFFSLLLALVCAVVGMIVFSAYRTQRIKCFLDPWSVAYDCGYQLTQSLIAFGRGEFFGMGLGKSIQKLFYLPEAHTDFVYAILAEELGFVGAATVVVLFSALIFRILRLARKAELSHQLFPAYLSYGIALLLAVQVTVNIGMNIGLLPTKGLTLPLLSYGGSSLMAMAIMIGILLRIDADMRYSKAQSSLENTRSRRLAA